ncbi:MAG: hypothetical protein Hyperionvirus3_119 [Hyperionvirus sp.]|uniref:Uncharacterized protein n=1 Tax=Hyperionvirus sp. TaxID=2487770 RepID=A0A3G5AAW3_9VIRU|nr:MAG: hypothetical protein Hyperionvirus3_119 [Hyperionvirus sp.]
MAAITYCSSVTTVVQEREGKTLSECKTATDDQRTKAIAELESCVKGFMEAKITLEDNDSFISKKSVSKLVEMCTTALAAPKIKESSMILLEYYLMMLRLQVNNLPKYKELGDKFEKFKSEPSLSMTTKLQIATKTFSSGAEQPIYVAIETEKENDGDNELDSKFVTTVYKDVEIGKELLTSCWHSSDDAAVACHMHFADLVRGKHGSTIDKIKWKTEGAPSSHGCFTRGAVAA